MLTLSFVTKTEYPIRFVEDPFAEIRETLPKGRKIAVITDATIEKLFGKEMRKAAKDHYVEILSFSPGEEQKNLGTVEVLCNLLQEKGFGRKNTFIIAFGGGVVGDVGGFIASVYMRGVPYIQVPTTLLSMVDSSIGGKTGVNTKFGKNLIGSFYHPQKVIISPSFLKNLPEKEIRNGLSEMVKHSVIEGRKHFDLLEKNAEKILKLDTIACIKLIKKSVQVKERIVSIDEKEKGVRTHLNFGHTVGHAVEKASHYEIPHGYAVSIGMVAEARIAEKRLGFPGVEDIIRILTKCGLPTEIPSSMKKEEITRFMKHDKKNEGLMISYSLPRDFGKMELCSFSDAMIDD